MALVYQDVSVFALDKLMTTIFIDIKLGSMHSNVATSKLG